MGSYYDEDWHEGRWDDEFDHRDRETIYDCKACVLRFSKPEHEGECRLYLAPCVDGSWFAWGDWHAEGEEQASDAVYDFAEGGAYFSTRDEALTAVLEWVRDLACEEIERLNPAVSYEI